jgi:YVTN family beta-propeller protein
LILLGAVKKPDLEYYFTSRKIKKEALYVSAMLTVTATILPFSIILVVLVSSYSYLFNMNNVVIAQRDNTSLSNGYNDNNNGSSGRIASNRSDDGLITNASSFPPSILSESGIDVNTFPVGIAVNPNTKKVYVANEYSNTVSVIDTETDKVQNRINVDVFPYGIDTNPLNNRVYVTNKGSNTVSVIDGSIDTKLLDISVGKSPVGVAVNPSANWIYVTNLEDGTLSIIDGISNEVIKTLSVGKIPYGIAVNPLSNKIYVTDIDLNTVSIIDGETNNITAKISVGKRPTGLAIDITEGNNRLYVANHDSDSISVIDTLTNNVIDNITSGGDSPVGIAINPITSKLYVSNIASNTVSVIDTKAVNTDDDIHDKNKTDKTTTTSFKNDIILKEISVNPTMKKSYSGEDSLVNLPSYVGFPLLASHITIDPYENRIYITNTGSNTISLINGYTDEVAVRLTFNINPTNTGEIRCNGVKNISGNSTAYNKGQILQCVAIPERGYTFASWSDLANDLNSNPLTLETSGFGTLTANFKPAITLEVYVFVIGGIVGAASVLIGWYYKYGQRRYVNRYLTRIQSTYDTLHEKDKEQCILQLHRIRTELIYLFKKGSLSDSHYNILDKKTSDYIEIVRNEEEEEEKKQT